MAAVPKHNKGSDTDRSQPEAWMFTNHAFEEALTSRGAALLTSRGMRTMEEEQERMAAAANADAMADAEDRPTHLSLPTNKRSVHAGKPRTRDAEGPSSLARKFWFGGGKGTESKRQTPALEQSSISGWTFTNPLALMEPESGGAELQAAFERAQARANSSSTVPPLELGALPAHLSPDRAANDSEDEDEEVVVAGTLREKYLPVVTPRDYTMPAADESSKPEHVVTKEECDEKIDRDDCHGERQKLVAATRANGSVRADRKDMKKGRDNSSGSDKTREPQSPASPQGSIPGALPSSHSARARLRQAAAFDSPASPLLRTQQCFTPTYSRTSAPAGIWTHCTVERWRKKGNGKSSKFVMRSESGEILLAAKRSKVDRVIRFFRPNWKTNYSECVGLAHYDALGAQFVLRGADLREKVTTDALMAILFGLTTEGPRRVSAVLPHRKATLPESATIEELPTLGGPRDVDAIFKAIHTRNPPKDVEVLKSSMPVWDSRSKTFRMDFRGRVKKPSVKNMKLESAETHSPHRHDSENSDPQKMKQRGSRTHDVFMCGRINANTFVCDFQAPLTPLEAFCIACADLIHKPIYTWI